MSEIASLEEARKNRAKHKNDPAARVATPLLTDNERINIAVESMKLAYQAILEIFERLEAVRKTS